MRLVTVPDGKIDNEDRPFFMGDIFDRPFGAPPVEKTSVAIGGSVVAYSAVGISVLAARFAGGSVAAIPGVVISVKAEAH